MATMSMRAYLSVCEWTNESESVCAYAMALWFFEPHQILVCKCEPDSQSFAQELNLSFCLSYFFAFINVLPFT